jgi:hypothetical protein
MINIQNNIADISIGNISIGSAYVGSQLVWQKGPLPEFIEVDYIENTSTAYINTGVNFLALSPAKYMSITIDLIARPSAWRAVFGSRWKADDVDSCIIQLDTSNKWFSKINGTGYRLGTATVGRHVLVVQNNMCYVDGTAFTTAKTIPRYSAATMTLLASHNLKDGSVADLGLRCKIIACEIGNGNDLVRNYVPAYQTSTGLYGLLDKVNNVFYTSPNGALFTGP